MLWQYIIENVICRYKQNENDQDRKTQTIVEVALHSILWYHNTTKSETGEMSENCYKMIKISPILEIAGSEMI